MPRPDRVALGGLLLLCALVAGRWLVVIPFDQAPDEWTHVHYHVRHLLVEHRLPRLGVDDTTAYLTATAHPTGRLVARYSYANAPWPYLGHAFTTWIGMRIAGTDPVTGARIFSLVCVLVFAAAVYGAGRTLGAPPGAALGGAAMVALIPQVLFIGAYVNQDAFSLAVSALLLWALAFDARRGTAASMAVAGLAMGALLAARVPFWVLEAVAAAWVLWRLRQAESWAARGRLGLAAGAPAVALAALIVGGNLARDGDLTGLDYSLWLMREAQGRIIEPPLSLQALRDLFAHGFLGQTFRSSLMTFDYMSLIIPVRFVYRTAGLILLGSLVTVVIAVRRARDGRGQVTLAGLLALGVVAFSLHVYNSLVFDYQPQGRYLFALLAPCGVGAAWLGGRHRAVLRAVWVVALSMGALTFLAHRTVEAHYARFNGPTVAGARARALGLPPHTVLDTRVETAGAPLSGVRIELATAPAYDVAFWGLEVSDPDTGAVLRRSYVLPWEWRMQSSPVFVFKRMMAPPTSVHVRVTAAHPGVHPLLVRTDCGPGGQAPCLSPVR
jgi:hypothetical protein